MKYKTVGIVKCIVLLVLINFGLQSAIIKFKKQS